MFNNILVAVALDAVNKQKTIDAAKNIGGKDATYHLIAIVPSLGGGMVLSFLPQDYEKRILAGANETLHEFSKKYFDGYKVRHIVAHGKISEEINKYSENCDLIVIGTGKGQEFGTNASRIARRAPKPVLIVR